MTKLLLAQCQNNVGKPAENLSRLESILAGTDADIVILPEMYLTGYVPRDDLPSLAEAADGATATRLSKLCADSGRSLIVGLPLRHPSIKGQTTNSALAVDARGKVNRYDKAYLPTFGPFEESQYFHPGKAPLVADLSGTNVGIVICYDLFFPELSKLLALQGADLIVCISASPTATVANFKKLLPGRAIENAAYVAYVNLVGNHLGLMFGGESRLIDPRGDVVAEAKPLVEDIVGCEMDLSKLEFARRMRPTARDTRKEVFEAILEKMRFV